MAGQAMESRIASAVLAKGMTRDKNSENDAALQQQGRAEMQRTRDDQRGIHHARLTLPVNDRPR